MTTVTITSDQAIVWSSNPIPLPIFEVDVEKIVVDFPCKLRNTLNPEVKNIQPSYISMIPIEVLYPCD